MKTIAAIVVAAGLHAGQLHAQSYATLNGQSRAFVSVPEAAVALTHVQLIDGTGAPPAENQTVVITDGRITAVGAFDRVPIPPGHRVVDLTGHTVIPGLVGMHNHTYFNIGQTSTQMSFTGPRLNLAGGVTTIRTAGSRAPYNELNQKRAIEAGQMPGPRMYTTGPYLNGSAGGASSSVALTTPEDARRVVAYWAEEGASWLKFQGSVTREVLGAAIDEAHRRGIKVTGHLCSVTFREAAALGIDNLEHGLITNSDYVPNKRPDECPPENMTMQVGVDVYGEAVQATFRDLVSRGVAMTSTLSVYELFVPSRATVQERVLDAMAPEVRQQFLRWRDMLGRPEGGFIVPEALFEKMMQYEREFVNAGGLLAAGVDPWGNGSLPGYGDQRNYELLIEAGFSPAEAVQIMSANGAKLLGAFDRLGSVEVDKLADMAVIEGDLAADPSAINHVTLVFKDGVGFDSAKLIESVRGQVGIR